MERVAPVPRMSQRPVPPKVVLPVRVTLDMAVVWLAPELMMAPAFKTPVPWTWTLMLPMPKPLMSSEPPVIWRPLVLLAPSAVAEPSLRVPPWTSARD